MPDSTTSASLPFNDGWQFQRNPQGVLEPVTLPHDAMMGEGRRADAPSGWDGAFFLGGLYHYKKLWRVPKSLLGKELYLRFDGVYRHSKVKVNGNAVGGCNSGYVGFELRIDPDLDWTGDNLIEVSADNRDQPSARWYTGSGIYRPVWLVIREAVDIKPHGIVFRTLSLGDHYATVSVKLALENLSAQPVDINVILSRCGKEVVRETINTTDSTVETVMVVPDAQLWSSEAPDLYDCSVRVGGGGYEHHVRVGIRTLEYGAKNGMIINGQQVLLRGACLHHDSGIIGAASFLDAEIRRLRILKNIGFNAVRAAHNPAAAQLLEACDIVGLYVMDEYSDYWYARKTAQDDAITFAENWKYDVDAMVAQARNHPSVVMYSIGNENAEPATAYGLDTAQHLAHRVRESDPTRAVTIGINLMMAAISWPYTRKRDEMSMVQPASGDGAKVNSTVINILLNTLGPLIYYAPLLSRTNVVTKDVFAAVDIAGYNYGAVRYAKDAKLHPERVVVGTETLPDDIVRNWSLVKKLPNVVGDFMWTGWDYLGEAGLGTWEYDGPILGRFFKEYPHLTAGTGVFDIIGLPSAPAFVAQAAWGNLDKPAIVVRPPHLHNKRVRRSSWRRTNAVPSWSWYGCEGMMAVVEVVSLNDEIELVLNSRSLGFQANTAKNNFTTSFTTKYEPGEITAIGYSIIGGKRKEHTRTTIYSAQSTRLHVSPEKSIVVAGTQSLAYVNIQIVDERGTVEFHDDDKVSVEVTGPAELFGFGSGASVNPERFDSGIHSTFQGTAVVVLRLQDQAGTINVNAQSERHGSTSCSLEAR